MSKSATPLFEAPHPGSQEMPCWDTGELIDAPKFSWRNALGMIGPGLVLGAAAIGGGEWLAGPAVTAKYGGSLLWVTTLSILAQVIYNIEISRYTLYTGEPIFTGKFRLLPGPLFWLVVYLIFDWGALLPYLAVNSAPPLLALIRGELPDPVKVPADKFWLQMTATCVYAGCMLPLIFGGKVYNSLKVIMSFKLVVVLGFLLTLGIFYSHLSSWQEIFSGFLKIGTMPISRDEDANGNGKLDEGEDFDRDGHLDVVEVLPRSQWKTDAKGNPIREYTDVDGDRKEDGGNVESIFTLFQTGKLGQIDFTLIAVICGLAGIAGNGGLTNTPTSNFTRDQGWGMGHHVGSIPSMVGGQGITLSHVGCVFQVTKDSLVRWKHWVWHVQREQIFVWMLACFIGVALPSMLSVEFLPRGTEAKGWNSAVLTAGGVQDQITNPPPGVLVHTLGLQGVLGGTAIGKFFWCGTLFCGFLVLVTSCASTMDGFIRRWVDTIWTSSASLRKLDTSAIKYVYFTVLLAYCAIGFLVIWLPLDGKAIFEYATMGYNLVFALSAWHTVAVNSILLPKELRPNMLTRVLLSISGFYFLLLGIVAIAQKLGFLG